MDLENEISNLELFAYGKDKITSEMVEIVVSACPAAQMYMLTDAVAAGDFKKAMNMLPEFIHKPEESLSVLGYLFSFVCRMIRIKSMEACGMTREEIIKSVGGHPFQVKKSIDSAARFTRSEFIHFVELLYRADRAMKRNKDYRLILDSLLLRMCNRKAFRRKVKK